MAENVFDIKTWTLDHLEDLTNKAHSKDFDDMPKQVQARICECVVILEQIIN